MNIDYWYLREQAYLGPVCLQKDPTKVYKQMRGQTIFVMNGRISVKIFVYFCFLLLFFFSLKKTTKKAKLTSMQRVLKKHNNRKPIK